MGWEHKHSFCLIVPAGSKLVFYLPELFRLLFSPSSYFLYFIVSDAKEQDLLCVEVSVLLELSIVQT